MRPIALLLVSLTALTAFAQNNRSFVATYGNDANNCTAGNECRTFARALSVTNPGGEVLALTSGGYGPFTITQSVTVIATTGAASITATGGVPPQAVKVSAGATDRVVLKGLTITADSSTEGIYADGYGILAIDGCSVTGSSDAIIITGPTNSIATITDTVVRGATMYGFTLENDATLSHCRAENNGLSGVDVGWGFYNASPTITVTDLVSSGNLYGVHVGVGNASGHNTKISLDHALLANNTSDGLFCDASVANSSATAYVTNSAATENGGYGFDTNLNGAVYSLRNNAGGANQQGDTNGSVVTLTAY